MANLKSQKYRSFIERLVTARTKSGVSQVELARTIGLSQQLISRIEQCERRLDALELVDYADAIGADWVKIVDPSR